jgi:hypothetical protein
MRRTPSDRFTILNNWLSTLPQSHCWTFAPFSFTLSKGMSRHFSLYLEMMRQ